MGIDLLAMISLRFLVRKLPTMVYTEQQFLMVGILAKAKDPNQAATVIVTV
jgi:hypothetical protein